MVTQCFSSNIPSACQQQIQNFLNAGEDVIWVAFPPGDSNTANKWVILCKSGRYAKSNLPTEAVQWLSELSTNGAKVIMVAFMSNGGYSIVNDQGSFLNRNIPADCHQKMIEHTQNGRITSVAFGPVTNSWSIVNINGLLSDSGIPQDCHDKMVQLAREARVTCVAFPPQGGSGWLAVNEKGTYATSGIPDEANMMMGYYTQVYGPIKYVAFNTDGSGWSIGSPAVKNERVGDGTRSAAIVDIYQNIQTKLNGKCVGYGCVVAGSSLGAYSWGQARTAANGSVQMFTPQTKITVASVSKVITALAAIAFLAKKGISLDTGIGPYVPKDWTLDPYVASITFRQFLQQRSGIRDYGNNDQQYATDKAFFTQKVSESNGTINPNDQSYFYTNYNFAIFRILLPIVNGFNDTSSQMPQLMADMFIKITQQNVFNPVSAMSVDARPPANGPFAYGYVYPGTKPGYDWGDCSLGLGAAGWYISIEDITKVLYSLNKNDGRILTSAQLNDMFTTKMGWDNVDGTGVDRYIQKSGGFGAKDAIISTTIALLGTGIIGAIFMNSDILGPGLQSNWKWCTKCQTLCFAGSATLGPCPKGDLHDHQAAHNICLFLGNTGPTGSVGKWRHCKKCEALCFTDATGKCSGGGDHDLGGSELVWLTPRGTGALPIDTEENWRQCTKCMVLANAGNVEGSACAAGGTHDYTNSTNFTVGYMVTAPEVLKEAYQSALKS